MFISFGELDKKSLLFIFLPVVLSIRWLLESLLLTNRNFFFNSFKRFWALSLNIILWLFLKYKMSYGKRKTIEENQPVEKELKNEENANEINGRENDDEKEKKDSSTLSLNFSSQYHIERTKEKKRQNMLKKIKRNIKCKGFVLLILAGILNFVCEFMSHIMYELKAYEDLSGGIVILSANVRVFIFPLLSYYLIQSKSLHKHQFYSIIIISVVIFLLIISSFIFENNKNKQFFQQFGIMIFPEIGYSFLYTIGLLYLIKSDCNVYQLLFLIGIICIILSLLIQFIFSNIDCQRKDYFLERFQYCQDGKFITILSNFESFEKFGGFLSIGIIISNFIENVLIYLIAYNFSIIHFGVINAIPTYLRFVIDNYSVILRIYYTLGGIIIIFMTLVYTEIVILKFWGLDKNTKKEIQKRSITESELIIDEDGKDEKDDDSVEYEKQNINMNNKNNN